MTVLLPHKKMFFSTPRLAAAIFSGGLLSLASTCAYAQTPFNMGPEGAPERAPVMQQPTVVPSLAPPPTVNLRKWQRFLIPTDQLSVRGEQFRRSWNISLSDEEASSAATLNIGYQNAILVAPENSFFTVTLNNTEILRQAIRSSDQMADVNIAIPAKLLRAGNNTISLNAHQRHRTDCSIQSTYELWTNIDGARTFLTFDLNPEAETVSGSLRDINNHISTIGVNAKGETHFTIIAPGSNNNENGNSLMRLSQALAILGGMPNQSFSVEKFLFSDVPDENLHRSGELTVLLGTYDELSAVAQTLNITFDTKAPESIEFFTDPSGRRILLVAGTNWQRLKQSIDRIAELTDRPADVFRTKLNTQNWHLPDAPMVRTKTTLTFSELGIPTQQFDGRRFSNEFIFGIPADFYANSYGNATIYMDAAYSSEVLPGSRIDIYVNDNIATTIPITNPGGGVMRQLPINISMRNFRPGVNTVVVEAALLTNQDNACAPGAATSQGSPRFALFDSSTFSVPTFARIGQTPNLAAIAGMAYPYSYSRETLPLVANFSDFNVMAASATILGNLASAAGRPFDIATSATDDQLLANNAFFVGNINNLPDAVLSRVGLNPGAKNSWSDDDADVILQDNKNLTLKDWQQLHQSNWVSKLQNMYSSLRTTFNISDELRLFPGETTQYTPSREISAVMAQGPSPSSNGAWTVFTAPDNAMLRTGAQTLTQQENWNKSKGRITAYNRLNADVETMPVQNLSFIPTQPFSISNWRLIATNWLSSNALSYVILIIAFFAALGLTTSALISRLGRRDDE
ncbi:cellulose biosynthesis cyclic di-GMP-binding regulatory protein BcsB [Brucella sp. 21LCYQ03]|nr:cellulose biosynthesis cyclic di-GMP-binding regulatory protein BcsB [Brucella sp. 21LCYQ03]